MSEPTPDREPGTQTVRDAHVLGMTTKPSDQEVWDAATASMGGEGISRRSGSRIDPPLHIFAYGDRLWCTSGKGYPANTMTRRYCRTCLRLAHEMWDNLREASDA